MMIESGEFNFGFEFISKVVGGNVLKEYISGVEKGIKLVMDGGILVGFLFFDVKVILIDGVYYDVDSFVMVFEIVGCVGFCEGFK